MEERWIDDNKMKDGWMKDGWKKDDNNDKEDYRHQSNFRKISL